MVIYIVFLGLFISFIASGTEQKTLCLSDKCQSALKQCSLFKNIQTFTVKNVRSANGHKIDLEKLAEIMNNSAAIKKSRMKQLLNCIFLLFL